jgi:hypothetical protein
VRQRVAALAHDRLTGDCRRAPGRDPALKATSRRRAPKASKFDTLLHAGPAKPFRVSPPEAAVYFTESEPQQESPAELMPEPVQFSFPLHPAL